MKQPESTPLADLLRAARARSGLTAREVARRARVDVGTVTRIELGQIARPQPDSVTAIGAVLGVSAADLFAAADWLPREELPTLRPYLRAKYRELPDEALSEVEALLVRYTDRYGRGPTAGEDER